MAENTEKFGTLKLGSVEQKAAAEDAAGKKSRVIPKLADKRDTSAVVVAWARVQSPVTEICPQAEVGPQARWLFRDSMTVLDFIERLRKNQLFRDALRVLAAALPKREAVYWACQCVRATAGKAPPAEAVACVKAAEAWVKEPSEANRRAAEAADKAATPRSVANAVVLAAFWSGGSLAPAGAPEVRPGEHLTGEAVADAILLAAIAPEPQQTDKRLARFLAEGLEVANGTRRWKRAAAPEKPPDKTS